MNETERPRFERARDVRFEIARATRRESRVARASSPTSFFFSTTSAMETTAHDEGSEKTSRLATHAFVRVSHAHTTPSSSPLSNRPSSSLTANAVTRPECPPKNATGTTGSPGSASPFFVSQRTMLPSSPPVHLVVVAAPSAATARASTNAMARWRGGTDSHAPRYQRRRWPCGRGWSFSQRSLVFDSSTKIGDAKPIPIATVGSSRHFGTRRTFVTVGARG